MTKLLERPEEHQAHRVGICHHGFKAYAITDGTARLWHSGPALRRGRATIERFRTVDGLELALCEGRDPYAP